MSNRIRISVKSCPLRDNRSNNSNNNRLSFDTFKTGGFKPARTMGEGCGSTERRVCTQPSSDVMLHCVTSHLG